MNNEPCQASSQVNVESKALQGEPCQSSGHHLQSTLSSGPLSCAPWGPVVVSERAASAEVHAQQHTTANQRFDAGQIGAEQCDTQAARETGSRDRSPLKLNERL